MSAKELLVKGKAVLAKRGVNRDGGFVNSVGGDKVCVVGALLVARGAKVENFPLFPGVTDEIAAYRINAEDDQWTDALLAETYLEQALSNRGVDTSMMNVRMFNDMSKDDQEVFSLFDEAIALAS